MRFIPLSTCALVCIASLLPRSPVQEPLSVDHSQEEQSFLSNARQTLITNTHRWPRLRLGSLPPWRDQHGVQLGPRYNSGYWRHPDSAQRFVEGQEHEKPGPTWDQINREKYGRLARHFGKKELRKADRLEKANFAELKNYERMIAWQAMKNANVMSREDQAKLNNPLIPFSTKQRVRQQFEMKKAHTEFEHEARKKEYEKASKTETESNFNSRELTQMEWNGLLSHQTASPSSIPSTANCLSEPSALVHLELRLGVWPGPRSHRVLGGFRLMQRKPRAPQLGMSTQGAGLSGNVIHHQSRFPGLPWPKLSRLVSQSAVCKHWIMVDGHDGHLEPAERLMQIKTCILID